MNKAWLYCSLLAVAALGVSTATLFYDSNQFDFMSGAEKIGSTGRFCTSKGVGSVQSFNLHVPYERAWSEAETELCEKNGWRLSGVSHESQIFDHNGMESISISPGRVNNDLDFLDGTDATDTFVVIRKRNQ